MQRFLHACRLPRSRSAKLVTLPLIALLVSGCEKASRDCPEFYHPLAAEFSTVEIGGSMRFAASSGAVVDFTLLSIENNEPFTSRERGRNGDPDDIDCELDSVHTYRSTELDLDLTLTFEQIDQVGRDPVDQSLRLDVLFRDPDTGARSGFGFLLSDFTAEGDEGLPGTLRYDESREFGQRVFTEVSEITLNRDAPVFSREQDPAEARVFRIALARGVGPAEYEQVDGTVYTRIMP